MSKKNLKARVKSAKLALRHRNNYYCELLKQGNREQGIRLVSHRHSELMGMQALCSILEQQLGIKIPESFSSYIDSECDRILQVHNEAAVPEPEPLPPMEPAPEHFSEHLKDIVRRTGESRTVSDFVDILGVSNELAEPGKSEVQKIIRGRFRQLHADFPVFDMDEAKRRGRLFELQGELRMKAINPLLSMPSDAGKLTAGGNSDTDTLRNIKAASRAVEFLMSESGGSLEAEDARGVSLILKCIDGALDYETSRSDACRDITEADLALLSETSDQSQEGVS